MTEASERPPVWREDFPIASSGEEDVTRREFVRYLVLASGAFAGANVAIAVLTSLQSVNEGSPRRIVSAERVPAGGYHLFRYPTDDDPAILLRLPDGELHAFSQKCTHLGCVVYFEEAERHLICPCHEGVFDAGTGEALAGPPERPLGRIDVEVRDGIVWALGAEP